MTSTKEFRDYVLEQLALVPDVSYRPMMGEFLLYAEGVLFGGIYDDRLLVKIVLGFNDGFGMREEIPYEKGKPMYCVEDVDDREKVAEIVRVTVDGLSR